MQARIPKTTYHKQCDLEAISFQPNFTIQTLGIHLPELRECVFTLILCITEPRIEEIPRKERIMLNATK